MSRQTLYHFRITYSYIYIYVCVYICVYVCGYLCVCVCVCMCVCVHMCVQLHIYIHIIHIICAKQSDSLCIRLRKCDFLTEKLAISRIRIRNYLFRIQIRILQKVPDPTGSGSTTLEDCNQLLQVFWYLVESCAAIIILIPQNELNRIIMPFY